MTEHKDEGFMAKIERILGVTPQNVTPTFPVKDPAATDLEIATMAVQWILNNRNGRNGATEHLRKGNTLAALVLDALEKDSVIRAYAVPGLDAFYSESAAALDGARDKAMQIDTEKLMRDLNDLGEQVTALGNQQGELTPEGRTRGILCTPILAFGAQIAQQRGLIPPTQGTYPWIGDPELKILTDNDVMIGFGVTPEHERSAGHLNLLVKPDSPSFVTVIDFTKDGLNNNGTRIVKPADFQGPNAKPATQDARERLDRATGSEILARHILNMDQPDNSTAAIGNTLGSAPDKVIYTSLGKLPGDIMALTKPDRATQARAAQRLRDILSGMVSFRMAHGTLTGDEPAIAESLLNGFIKHNSKNSANEFVRAIEMAAKDFKCNQPGPARELIMQATNMVIQASNPNAKATNSITP